MRSEWTFFRRRLVETLFNFFRELLSSFNCFRVVFQTCCVCINEFLSGSLNVGLLTSGSFLRFLNELGVRGLCLGRGVVW